MIITTWPNSYQTVHELAFVRHLHKQNPLAFHQYAGIVQSGMRVYDSTVDRQAVLAAIVGLMGKPTQ